MSGARARRGLTLIELVLATGLLSILVLAVFALLDGSLSLWRRAETRRALTEQGSVVLELLDRDLRALEPGERGDVLADWERFDTDGDGVGDHGFPRLRLVRQASRAELARMAGPDTPPPLGPALVEVCWIVTPSGGDPDARSEGVLWRGERLIDDTGALSYFDSGFIGRSGKPPGGALDEVTGGILWLGPLFATQTSILHSGWDIGSGLEDVATSWDAWNAERPDDARHPWNVPGAGMPAVDERPLLPRRVRIELELERELDRRRRTRLSEALAANDVALVVDDADRLPGGEDAHVLVGGEWMRIRDVAGRRVTVERAQRGTEPRPHAAGLMVHWGMRIVREVPVTLYREDWNL